MMPVPVGVLGYDQIGKRVADALARQEDLRLAGVWETDPQRLTVLRARGIPCHTDDVQDWAASCGVVIVCRPDEPALPGKLVYGPHISAASALFLGTRPPAGTSQVRVPCADAVAFSRLLTCLPPVERLFSSCARRAGRATDRHWMPVDAMEPLFSLPEEDADLQGLLAPRVPSIVVRRTLVPYTHSHLHHLKLDLELPATREEALDALCQAPRVRLAAGAGRFSDTGHLQEYDRDLGRPRGDRPEIFVWEESVAVMGRSLILTADVHPDATTIPDLIDAARLLTRADVPPGEACRTTDRNLGIGGNA
jgi:glyceraldehyde-3-phosphate dehydrogenase (NAD(P))